MKLVMKLNSDAIPGSGEGLSGIIDTDIDADEYGIPLIPAKRIKGILRESALELNDVETLKHDVESIFGSPGSEKGTDFKISDGYIRDVEIYRDLLDYAANNEKVAQIFNREVVLDDFTYLRSQTTIENGTAKENTLRTFRVLKKGWKFHFDIQLPEDFHDDFENICKVTRRFGISRTRGLGEISLSFENTSQNENTTENLKADYSEFTGKPCKLVIEIKNKEQLLLASQVGNNQVTETCIPGNALLGTLANAFIKENKLKLPHTETDFREIFLNGSVTFSNALPVVDKRTDIRPAPASIVKLKDRDRYVDLAYKDEAGEYKGGPGEFVRITNGSLNRFDVETEMEYHHSRPDDKAVGHATENEGEFFQFSVLKAGQTFQAEITGPFQYLEKILQLLQKKTIFHIGKSRTAQYGRSSIHLKEIRTVEPRPVTWENGKSIVVTLLSDMILRNENGFVLPDPELLKDEIAGRLGKDVELEIDKEIDKEIDEEEYTKKTFLKFTRKAGFLGVWKMPKPQYNALKAGSVVVLKNISGKSLDTGEIDDRSFGENTVEGFGKVAVNWHGYQKISMETYTPRERDYPSADLSKIKKFIKRIVLKRLETQLRITALKDARECRLPSGSFTGKLGLFFKEAKSFNDLGDKYLKKLRTTGKKQLEKIESFLKIKGDEVNRAEVEKFIKGIKNKADIGSPVIRKILDGAGIDEDFFIGEEYLFEIYKRYAAFFLNALKLRRRENESKSD